jgi:hypothetical protein
VPSPAAFAQVVGQAQSGSRGQGRGLPRQSARAQKCAQGIAAAIFTEGHVGPGRSRGGDERGGDEREGGEDPGRHGVT